jgi:pSer/pThr/pTyr-binding forkhead associated (FHA) protein
VTEGSPKSDPTPFDGGATRDQLPKGSRPAVVFTVLTGPHVGERFEVRDAIVLGRDCELSPCFGETGVSRQHARVWQSAHGAFFIEDLGSTNGTFINEMKVERRALVVGDKLRLGPTLVLELALSYFTDPEPTT